MLNFPNTFPLGPLVVMNGAEMMTSGILPMMNMKFTLEVNQLFICCKVVFTSG